MIPSWSQIWRRLAWWWHLRKVHHTICRDCGFPFLMNGEGRDTANLERVEINPKDGSALCGECAPLARKRRERLERRRRAKAGQRDYNNDPAYLASLFMVGGIPDGGYEAREPGAPMPFTNTPALLRQVEDQMNARTGIFLVHRGAFDKFRLKDHPPS